MCMFTTCAYMSAACLLQQDIRLVVDKYKSGFPIPADHEFEDLGDPGVPGSNGQLHPQAGGGTPVSVKRSETMRAGGSGGTQSGKVKTRKGLFGGIFSSSKVTLSTAINY